MNLRNGFNFAKKVMTTGECDVLILDEILGIVDQGIISAEEFRSFLEARDEETDLIMTGLYLLYQKNAKKYRKA